MNAFDDSKYIRASAAGLAGLRAELAAALGDAGKILILAALAGAGAYGPDPCAAADAGHADCVLAPTPGFLSCACAPDESPPEDTERDGGAQ